MSGEPTAATVPVTDATFAAEVLSSELPVVVDFGADWCGPCRLVEPVLEEIAVAYAGRVKIVSVDTEANPVTVADYGIVSIPALYFFVGGELQSTVIGARPKAELVAEVDALLASV